MKRLLLDALCVLIALIVMCFLLGYMQPIPAPVPMIQGKPGQPISDEEVAQLARLYYAAEVK